jgi:hypothetical protein
MNMNILFKRDNTATLERRDATPRSFNRRDLTVEAVVATNALVRRRDHLGEFLERLDPAGADLTALRGASVLDSHERSGVGSVIGTIDDARLEGGEIIARIRFSARAEVAPIVDDVEAGILRSVSVGYEVSEWRDGTDAATGLRTRTATKWTPREVFVAIPADPNARTRQHPPGSRAAINREIRELGRRVGISVDQIDDLIDRSASIDDARRVFMQDMLARSEVHIRSGWCSLCAADNIERFRGGRVINSFFGRNLLRAGWPSPSRWKTARRGHATAWPAGGHGSARCGHGARSLGVGCAFA